jgi:predicted HTH domain antitoxin
MTRNLTIPYDDSVLLEASLTRDEFEREAKLMLAAKLFELGRLSSGRAAELCGLGRVEFLLALPRVGVSMSNLRPEDAAAADAVDGFLGGSVAFGEVTGHGDGCAGPHGHDFGGVARIEQATAENAPFRLGAMRGQRVIAAAVKRQSFYNHSGSFRMSG